MARIKGLDALKGVAILAVIVLHSAQPQDVAGMPFFLQIFNEICDFAVPCFFLVAGFLFMRSWHQRLDRATFIRRYAARILKPFLFWAFFYALVPPFVGGSQHGTGPEIWRHLVNIVRYPHAFLRTGFIYHLWFLSSLLQAAIIVGLFLRYGGLRMALLLGIVLYSLVLLAGPIRTQQSASTRGSI